ncbi:MAG: ABC transporter substrate-binding protein [bacterium]|nr:ABC transporter substrate-binding protein [bacterium]
MHTPSFRPFVWSTVAVLASVGGLSGCGGPSSSDFQPVKPEAVLLWDRQTTQTADLLRDIVAEFNAGRDGLPVEAEYIGNYTDIFQKVRVSIEAGSVPDLAVSYQSMTSEYIEAQAVVPLEGFIADPAIGLDAESLSDFFPAVIENNKFPEFGGRMYSFPFCKSVLMMYYNKRVLEAAGYSEPPATWDAFLEQCRAVKAKTGKAAYPVSVDASTVDGMIFSMGGEVVSGRTTLFDSPESKAVFALLETLAKEKLAYPIAGGSQDDKIAFSENDAAFVFRSSSHRTSMVTLMDDDPDAWGMAMIPQGDPGTPVTVLYGPSICIFATGPDRNRTAWEFVKFFTSEENNVRWALGSGYVPIRKSAADNPRMNAFWAEWKYNRAAYDCLPHAKSEPNVAGWQKVRGLIEKAEEAVLTGYQSADAALAELKRAADSALLD